MQRWEQFVDSATINERLNYFHVHLVLILGAEHFVNWQAIILVTNNNTPLFKTHE